MQSKKVTATRDQLLDPLAADWATIPGEPLKMDATPLANQPSEYIKASRDEKEIGKVRSLMVQAAHNGTDDVLPADLGRRDARTRASPTTTCSRTAAASSYR